MMRLSEAKAVLFDLDGTLVDTLPDIAWCLNQVLAQHQLAALPEARLRALVGGGVAAMIEQVALEQGMSDAGRLLADYSACYRQHLVQFSRPYAGIEQLLESLAARGLPMAVVTNKSHTLARQVLELLLPATAFDAVIGHQPGQPLKPAPDAALQAAERLGVAPGDCLFVGDTTIDLLTAQAAGMPVVAAGWGYGEPKTLRAHRPQGYCQAPDQLLAALCPAAVSLLSQPMERAGSL
ncbi:HAD-IA family hydrolase [Pseudomonas sichuanensis]|uniref:HAD family hydrolase n=1 Tax=Pseudomonas sichuanensis TaxID=2213015 RepID=UPI0024468B51|nr:HAD-IA family hydrolase [Pseudomonas sichuanensis]MDH0730005.1 HAD-IA family hydrolase [Pseudomonas sichuanensis]MDH1584527.1 HAD-IA family hydrolase [Pseudomonas sichuanensis]MDH1593655.1 HAD-IA family hydrolase [Pseudomonas sichuanensis]MDH1600190.1 HAD-IA family hydrolase [Pseudomonas sichuanensis]